MKLILVLAAVTASLAQNKPEPVEAHEGEVKSVRVRGDANVKARAVLRESCRKTYRATANKRQSDLTAKQAEMVKSCSNLGLYRE